MEHKNNQSNVTGNENIVIQDVSSSNITINIGGKVKKLEAAMNQWLVEQTIESVSEYKPIANKFIQKVTAVNQDWQNEKEYLDAGLVLLQALYIGVVGTYLNKIASISNQSFSEQKLKDYTKNSYLLSLRLLDLVNSTLISSLWEQLEKNKQKIETTPNLNQFFNRLAVRDIKFSFALFRELFSIYKSNQLELPIPEISKLENQIKEESALEKALFTIEEKFSKSNNQDLNGEDIFWVEKSLTDILANFNFLTKYKIQSVKELVYHHIKAKEEYFIHKIISYGATGKTSDIGKFGFEKMKHTKKATYTDAVMILKDDDTEIINLFPFMVDYNSITLEQGINLCVFSHQDLTHDNLYNFISIQHNKFIGIETNEELSNDYEKIYSDKKSVIQLKKNLISELLNKAKTTIIN